METIFCPTDFSPASENAIRYADQLAHWLQARIILFHNIYEPLRPAIKSFGGVHYAEPIRDAGYRQQQLDQLHAWREKFAGTGGSQPVRYETKIRYGPTQDNIAEEAQRNHANVIVLGSKERQGLKQLFTGSVVGDVVRQSPCPVLIVPADTAFQPITKIVFAISLLDQNSADLAFLARLATLFQAKIFFLHILTQYSGSERQQVEAAFEQFRQSLPSTPAALHVETHDNIESGIVQFTRQLQADLLVMGYHPHSFLEGLILGDRTKSMASHPALPLLVLHH